MTEAARLVIQKFNAEFYSNLYLRITQGWHYDNLFRRTCSSEEQLANAERYYATHGTI